MIVTTPAVVLRSRPFRDTSKIVSFFTKDFGRLSAIAKGARTPKSPFAGMLEPMSSVTVVLYKKELRDLQLLSQCDMNVSFMKIVEDEDRLRAGISMVEMVYAFTRDDEKHEELFELLVASLTAVNNATKNTDAALYFFELRLLDLLGFRPNLDRCRACSSPVPVEGSTGGMSPDGVMCHRCAVRSKHAVGLCADSVLILQSLQRCDSAHDAIGIPVSQPMTAEIDRALRWYVAHHGDGSVKLQSYKVFDSISLSYGG